MLSNYERRELARIEAGLRADPDGREPRAGAGRPAWARRCGLQLLIGFAGLVMTIGVIATDGPLLLQGVLMMGGACAWWLCRQVAAAKAEPQSPDREPEH